MKQEQHPQHAPDLAKDVAYELASKPPQPDYSKSIHNLVLEFAVALNQKLQAAITKYRYHEDGWLDKNWEKECREELLRHIEKGDPRDVAAYCAFMWHHGWSTASPVVHNLKTWPEHYKEVASGRKTAELRYADRYFRVGDLLCLKEYDPHNHGFTGQETTVEVTHIFKGPEFGLLADYVMLSFKPISSTIKRNDT